MGHIPPFVNPCTRPWFDEKQKGSNLEMRIYPNTETTKRVKGKKNKSMSLGKNYRFFIKLIRIPMNFVAILPNEFTELFSDCG